MSNEFKLVPVEPTAAMVNAALVSDGIVPRYYAMLEAAPQPPALGGEPESKLIKLAAELASRRPIRSLQDLCDRQKSVSTAKLIEDVEMCGDFLAAIAVDIRHCVEASRAHLAPLQAEIERLKACIKNNALAAGAVVEGLHVERDQLKARNAELESALKFYADREHYHFESGNWDTVSGEPLNILWCSDEPDFIEDGSVARNALSKPAGSEQS